MELTRQKGPLVTCETEAPLVPRRRRSLAGGFSISMTRFLLLPVLVGCTFAQVVPAPQSGTRSSTPPPAEEAVLLSPFEVNADLDTGYLATTAQSGTRLRTELKDIASSISVVTKDFMND